MYHVMILYICILQNDYPKKVVNKFVTSHNYICFVFIFVFVICVRYISRIVAAGRTWKKYSRFEPVTVTV